MTVQCGDRYKMNGIPGRAWSRYDDGIINCCHAPMVSPPVRVRMKRKPVRAHSARYEERIVEVLREARGQRVMIRSIHSGRH